MTTIAAVAVVALVMLRSGSKCSRFVEAGRGCLSGCRAYIGSTFVRRLTLVLRCLRNKSALDGSVILTEKLSSVDSIS